MTDLSPQHVVGALLAVASRACYNVELAHVYIDQEIGPEQLASVAVAVARIADLTEDRQSITTSVLIDDYNPTTSRLDVDAYLAAVSERGIAVDYLVYESALVAYAERLLEDLPARQHDQQVAFQVRTGKFPCSFLIAAWHLVRLGIIPFEDACPTARTKKPFTAERTITVLPEHFHGVERTAVRLLRATPHWSQVRDRLEYIYF